MNSVTEVVRKVKQPKGGILPINWFDVIDMDGEPIICDKIPPVIVGKVIDSMLHLTIRTPKEKLFKSSISGYDKRVEYFARQFTRNTSGYELMYEEIEAEDDILNVQSLIGRLDKYRNECDLYNMALCLSLIHQYDIWDMDFQYISRLTTVQSSRPTYYTKGDIRKLVKLFTRTLQWICSIITDKVIVFDFKFYPNGYTDTIQYGVGDFVCSYTLFDLKCTKSIPSNLSTLQILIYYVMGLNSGNRLYSSIKYLGLYSPITNKLWRLDVRKIPADLIKRISTEVVGYEQNC